MWSPQAQENAKKKICGQVQWGRHQPFSTKCLFWRSVPHNPQPFKSLKTLSTEFVNSDCNKVSLSCQDVAANETASHTNCSNLKPTGESPIRKDSRRRCCDEHWWLLLALDCVWNAHTQSMSSCVSDKLLLAMQSNAWCSVDCVPNNDLQQLWSLWCTVLCITRFCCGVTDLEGHKTPWWFWASAARMSLHRHSSNDVWKQRSFPTAFFC